MAVWLCRAGRYGEYENRFLEDGRAYCNWDEISSSFENFTSRKEIQEYLTADNNETKLTTAANWAGQIWAFYHEMKPDDLIILPSKKNPVVHVGRITGDYCFNADTSDYRHSRTVEWYAQSVPRKEFDQDIIYTLGSLMTICKIKQEERVNKIVNAYLAKKGQYPNAQPDETDAQKETPLDIEGASRDLIGEYIIQKTKGHKMSRLVASILRAKGFSTYESPEGADKGVDILAAPGILGFGQPKLCVQVKSTDSPTDRLVLDQLVGVMKKFNAEYGLLVSWGGFKNSVVQETASNFFSVRLWTHKEIVDEFLANYENLDDEIKSLIPLKKIWAINLNEE